MTAALVEVRMSVAQPRAARFCRHPMLPAAAPQLHAGLHRPPAQRPAALQQSLVARAVAVDLDKELQPQAASSIHIESLVYADGCYSVQGCLRTPASADLVYQVLTDYESLTRVFHNVTESRVQRCSATGGQRLVQTCKWAFLVFSGTFVNELDIFEDPACRQLSFSSLESAFMREFIGGWEVQQLPGGLTEVRHRLSVAPTVAPPQSVGDVSKRIFKKQVEGILGDLSQELQRRLAADVAAGAA